LEFNFLAKGDFVIAFTCFDDRFVDLSLAFKSDSVSALFLARINC
jgi:hypothetical protein